MREGISGLIPSFLSLSDSLYLSLLSVSLPFSFSSPLFPSHLSVSLSSSLSLPLWQAVVWLQLIAVEINKASKFVFLLYCVTQRKGDVFREVQSYELGAHL